MFKDYGMCERRNVIIYDRIISEIKTPVRTVIFEDEKVG